MLTYSFPAVKGIQANSEYYICIIPLEVAAACELDPDESGFIDIIQGYPQPYKNRKGFIAGLLVSTEAKRKRIDIHQSEIIESRK